jgi:hypothetical protein
MLSADKLRGVGVEVNVDLDMDKEGRVSIVAKRERNQLQLLD